MPNNYPDLSEIRKQLRDREAELLNRIEDLFLDHQEPRLKDISTVGIVLGESDDSSLEYLKALVEERRRLENILLVSKLAAVKDEHVQ